MSIGYGAQAVFRFAAFAIAAAFVSPSMFGAVAAGQIAINLLTHIAACGISVRVVQERSIEKEELRSIAGFLWLSGVAAALLGYVLSGPIAKILGISGYEWVLSILLLGGLVFPATLLNEGVLIRDRRFGAIAVVEIVSNAFGLFAVTCILLYLGFGEISVPLGVIAERLLRLLVSGWMAGTLVPRWPGRPTIQLMSSGAVLVPGNIANEFALRSDYIVVSWTLGLSALGIYERAYQVVSGFAVLIGQPLERWVFSATSRERDSMSSGASLNAMLKRIGLFAVPAGLVVGIVIATFLERILGPDWSDIESSLVPLTMFLFARVGYRVIDGYVMGFGENRRRSIALVMYALAVPTLSFVGSRWGLPGVSVGVGMAILFYYSVLVAVAARSVVIDWRATVMAHAIGFSIQAGVFAAWAYAAS